MRSVTLPLTLRDKLNSFYTVHIPDILAVCEASSLDREETSLMKRYIRNFLSFKKRGNIKDIPVIQRIVKNRSFIYNLSDLYIIYPFLEDLILDLSEISRQFSDLSLAVPWENWRTVNSVLASRSSYSCFSLLYAYITAMKPDSDEIRKYDRHKEGAPFKDNPVEDFYFEFKRNSEKTKPQVIELEFYAFCKCVLQFFPEEEQALREISIPGGNVEQVVNSAEIWVSQFLNEPQESEKAITPPAPKKRKARQKVGIVYDITLSQRTYNEISPDRLGEEFASYRVAIEQINANYPGVFPITNSGVAEALTCLYFVSGDSSDLTPIEEDEFGVIYEASIYRLYSIVKGTEHKPSLEDISRFIVGLDFLTYPRRFQRKERNASTGKEVNNVISLAFLYIYNQIHLPKIEKDEGGNTRVIAEQELGKQKVKFRIHKALFGGFPAETKDEHGKPLYLPIETKGKERRYFQKSSFKKATTEWLTFLNNITSCVQMREDNLLENVFDYQGAIEQAKNWDLNKIPCTESEIRHGKLYYFRTWEEYKKRIISKKEKTKDRKTLLKFFERAKAEGVIISFTFKDGVYHWRYKENAE